MSIYDDKPKPIEPKLEKPTGDYESLHNQLGTQLDYEDSVIHYDVNVTKCQFFEPWI